MGSLGQEQKVEKGKDQSGLGNNKAREYRGEKGIKDWSYVNRVGQ